MKDSFEHIFNGSVTLNNDHKLSGGRLGFAVLILLSFIIPCFSQAQHLDNRKRLDSFQRARTASASSILKTLANSYNVTGGGAYCSGGSGVVVGLDGSQQDTVYQLKLDGINIGAPVTGNDNPISFGLQTAAGTYTVVANTADGTISMNGQATVTITELPTATINYAATPFCNSVSAAQQVTLTGTGGYTGGTYTALPGGLSINSSTGEITPNTSTPGTYTVTYTIPASGGCPAVTATTSVTITALPTASLSYTGTPFCRALATEQVATLTGTGAYTGGSYTASPGGLSINASTGAITPSTSTAGTYTVTYTTPASGGCAAVTTTTSVTITALPTATISYAETPFCTSVSSAQTVTLTGTGAYSGGTYSVSPSGLSINASTGAITPSTSTAGTYTITYTTPASGGCAAVSTTTTVTITAVPTATITYTGTPFCTTVSAATVTLTGTGAYTGGTFSAPAALTINSSTGEINPSTSTPGTYTITYVVPASGGCASVNATTSVTITALPTANLSYAGAPFCRSVTTAQAATLTGTGAYTGGSYTASPGGLSIDASTGAITPSTSTAGTYTVTYTTPASGGCAAVTTTTSVTITALPTATISYAGTPFCTSVSSAQTVTLTGTGAYSGGTYSVSPSGLSINASTGAITPSTSTAGTYTITYTTPASGGCAAVSTTTTVTITAIPTATITYTGTPFCTTVSAATVTLTGTGAYTGGTFSAPAALTINSSTGEINPSTSTPGTYTITYVVPASGGCASINATTSVTITALPTANLSYAGTPFCRSVTTAQAATLTGTGAYTGGTYSAAPAGLTISSTTGAITPSTSTAGTYTVTYTRAAAGGCAAVTATSTVTITAVPTATISYPGTPFCTTVGSASVTLTGTGAYTGGTFSAPAALTINSSTGEINPSTSTPGTYTITYVVPASGGCASVNATTSVTITALPTANLSYAGTPFCRSVTTAQAATLTGTGAYTGGTYSAAPAGLTISSTTGAITPSTSTAGTYTVTYTRAAAGGCAAVTATSTVTITAVPTATISYPGTPFCTTVGSASVTLTGTGAYTGGSFSAPAALTINSSTGEINPSTSTPGTYTITYVVPASGGCASINATTSVTITALPTANLSYAGAPFCRSVTTAQAATLTGTGAYTGGTYSAAPSGLTINTSTGAITPSTSTAGTYTVTYTKPASGGCAAVSTSTSVTIAAVPAANAGPDQTGAATCGLTSVTLAANTPAAGTGSWSIVSGAGGSIATPSSPTSTFTGTAGTTYTLRWTVTNPPCATSTDDVVITFNRNPTTANAGSAQSVCIGGNVVLAANAPTVGTALWSIVSGPSTSTAQFSSTTNPAATFTPTGTGSYVLRWTISNSPCAASTSNVTITVNALPAIPTISAGGPTTFCQGGSVTLTSSASSGYQWNLNGTAIPGAANQTYSAITGGSYTVTVTNATGCSRTSAATSITVNPTPTITVSPAAPSAFCSGGSVTLTASGANTYTWSPTEGLSITTGSTVIATPKVTTTYTVTGTGANGCTNSATVTVPVTPTPKGDITSSPPVCSGNNSGTITLSNYTGTIVRWESSTNGGASWTIINNTSTTQSYANLTQTTIYRVLLTLNNGCDGYSDVGIVPVNEPFTPTVTVNPPVICQGESATLRASDYGAPPFPLEDFGNANPAGWSGNDANNNNADENTDWGETGDGKVRWGKVYSSQAPPTNTKFMIVAGTTDGADQTSALITPPFSLVGVVNPVFGYMTALDFSAGTVGKVEISIDGGATYITLETFTGPAKVGNGDNGFVQRNYDLSAYIGQPDVRVRFHYFGTAGSIWAVDNVGLQGTFEPVTYQWSPLDYMTPAAGNTQTVSVTPPAGTHPYCVVATTGAGCASQSVCGQVEVKPLPVCSITGNNAVCPGSTNIYSGPATAGYTYQWTISGGATISGAATGQTVTVVANNTCGTYTLTLVTTLNGCASAPCTQVVNVADDIPPVITCPPAQVFCVINSNTYTIPPATASDNCSGAVNITYQITGATIRSGTGDDASGVFNVGVSTITWTATDVCGNTSTCTSTVTINPKPAPIIYHN